MSTKVVAALFGVAFGFVIAWGQLTDPGVIRASLLLSDSYVFLVMGSAIVVAGIGMRLLRLAGVRALLTGEPVGWKVESPKANHVIGSAVFGLGWGVAGTCPGPVAAMIGQGKLAGLLVAAGLLTGIAIQEFLARRRAVDRPLDTSGAA